MPYIYMDYFIHSLDSICGMPDFLKCFYWSLIKKVFVWRVRLCIVSVNVVLPDEVIITTRNMTMVTTYIHQTKVHFFSSSLIIQAKLTKFTFSLEIEFNQCSPTRKKELIEWLTMQRNIIVLFCG